MKFWHFIIFFLFFNAVCGAAVAQSASNNTEAMARYTSARKTFRERKYEVALSELEGVQRLLGKSNARIELLRMKIFLETGDLKSAEKSVVEFYKYPSGQGLQEEASQITLEVNRQLEEIAEAERLVPLVAEEERQKRKLIDKSSAKNFLMDLQPEGADGQHGIDIEGTARTGYTTKARGGMGGRGKKGKTGGRGEPGARGGDVYAIIQELEMSFTSPLIWIAILNEEGMILRDGYWDLSEKLRISSNGGSGGNGGRGQKGGNGGLGQVAYGGRQYGLGGSGGYGGDGGSAGCGASAGNITVYFQGSDDFIQGLSSYILLSADAGENGRAGRSGYGGKGGLGAMGPHGYRVDSGNKGDRGEGGDKCYSSATDGTINTINISLTELAEMKRKSEYLADARLNQLELERQINEFNAARRVSVQVAKQAYKKLLDDKDRDWKSVQFEACPYSGVGAKFSKEFIKIEAYIDEGRPDKARKRLEKFDEKSLNCFENSKAKRIFAQIVAGNPHQTKYIEAAIVAPYTFSLDEYLIQLRKLMNLYVEARRWVSAVEVAERWIEWGGVSDTEKQQLFTSNFLRDLDKPKIAAKYLKRFMDMQESISLEYELEYVDTLIEADQVGIAKYNLIEMLENPNILDDTAVKSRLDDLDQTGVRDASVGTSKLEAVPHEDIVVDAAMVEAPSFSNLFAAVEQFGKPVSCEVTVVVDEGGRAINPVGSCTEEEYVAAVVADIITTTRFRPKTVNGIPVQRKGVVIPIELRIAE